MEGYFQYLCSDISAALCTLNFLQHLHNVDYMSYSLFSAFKAEFGQQDLYIPK